MVVHSFPNCIFSSLSIRLWISLRMSSRRINAFEHSVPSSYYTVEKSSFSSSSNVITSHCLFCDAVIVIAETTPIVVEKKNRKYHDFPISCTCNNTGRVTKKSRKAFEVNTPIFRECNMPLIYCSCRRSERCSDLVDEVDDCKICINRISKCFMDEIIEYFVNIFAIGILNDIIKDTNIAMDCENVYDYGNDYEYDSDYDSDYGNDCDNDYESDNGSDCDDDAVDDDINNSICVALESMFSNSSVTIGLAGHDKESDDRIIFEDTIESVSQRIRAIDYESRNVTVSVVQYGDDYPQFSLLVAMESRGKDFLLLLALIRGIPVVSYNWLTECSIQTSWLDPSSFQLFIRPTTSMKFLFAGMTFAISIRNNDYLSATQVSLIIQEGGGQVVHSGESYEYLVVGGGDKCTEEGNGLRIVSCSLICNCIFEGKLLL